MKGKKCVQSTDERRRFERFNLKCRVRYQVTLEGNLSDLNIGESKNISQAGILLNTNWPLPLTSTVAIELDTQLVDKYIKLNNMQNYIEIENCPSDIVRIFGTVVHCKKVSDGSYDVGVHLVNK
jgi:hypothetical protein